MRPDAFLVERLQSNLKNTVFSERLTKTRNVENCEA